MNPRSLCSFLWWVFIPAIPASAVDEKSTLLVPIFCPAYAGEAVAVTIDHRSGDDWQLLSSARWASRIDRRTLVCVHWDEGNKRMFVKSVPLREIPGR